MTVRILTGDCRDVLKTLPDASVQCCVTSPPYYGLRDYGNAAQIGLEQTPDAYVAEMVAVFREVRRVLRDDGTLWLNIGDSYAQSEVRHRNKQTDSSTLATSRGKWFESVAQTCRKLNHGAKPKDLIGIPWLLAFALRADGWWLRQEIIWAKKNPMPESVTDRCTKAHESVFLLTKSARYFFDAEAIAEPAVFPGDMGLLRGVSGVGEVDGVAWHAPSIAKRQAAGVDSKTAGKETRNCRSVWTIASQPYSGAHFATMPPALVEPCILAGSSERGQCPHCGAPWARVVERSQEFRSGSGRSGNTIAGKAAVHGGGTTGDIRKGPVSTITTTGWSPSCDCPPHDPVQQTILDPFGGAGTTGLVADRLGRDAVLVELNPEYAALARDRIAQDAGMFAQVAT